MGRTFQRVPRPGRLLRSLTRFLLSQGRPRTVLCVSSPLRPTTGRWSTWGCTGVRKYPCTKCGRVLANKKMWKRHTSACVQGIKLACPDCGKQYASSQGMKQHQKAKDGADAPEMDEGFVCPYCHRVYRIKKSWAEHKPYFSDNHNCKGPYYCRVAGCPAADHPFTRVRNLNFHLSNMHGWKERWAWVLGTRLEEWLVMMDGW